MRQTVPRPLQTEIINSGIVTAFTNGSLIPSYFCNPVPDGLPKSLGELIPQTHKEQGVLAFNNNSKILLSSAIIIMSPLTKTVAGNNLNVVPVTNSTPGNTGYMLAAFREYPATCR
jgi:hypothetical protein